jgi:hypothetical protein
VVEKITYCLMFSGVPHTHHSPDVSIEDHMYGMYVVFIIIFND